MSEPSISESSTALDHEQLLRSIPNKSGVYRMVDTDGNVLYVGKAKDLKKRVGSYFRSTGQSTKTQVLIRKTCDVHVTVTSSETEALLLEQSFIKNDKPPYNVVLRDGKSYPFIHISGHEFPRIRLHRGSKREGGSYYGPFPSAAAVRESITILQKLFRLRTCEDSFFSNRSRPCLQYQINRCTGPCVGEINATSYAEDLAVAKLFLEGKNDAVLSTFKENMHQAAENLDFEKAANLRDQIKQLVRVQEAQYAEKGDSSIDVFGIAQDLRYTCIQGLFIRSGRILGHRTWYPKNELGQDDSYMLQEFLSQYYLGSMQRDIPKQVLTNIVLDDGALLSEALSQMARRKVDFASAGRTQRAQWIEMVSENAQLGLATYTAKRQNVFERLLNLQELLELEDLPRRLECFDISHSSGEATVASCVVFDSNGPLKSDYRRFNIRDITKGDDYAALEQAIKRRYTRVKQSDGSLPDVLVIDGGRGQLNRVLEVLEELQVSELTVLGISKGEGRKIGLETIWKNGNQRVEIPATSGAMHVLQHIRDEAHRFAITSHRNRRQKSRRVSELDEIEGIGPRRKRELLAHFGHISAIRGAGIEELAKVPGISKKLAEEIYGTFHVG